MATQTIKTKAQLLADIATLFPDNNDEAITPDNARDFFLDEVASSFGCYGGLILDAGDVNIQAAVAVAAGYVKLTNIGSAMANNNVTCNATTGELTIGTNGAGDYEISVVGSYRRFEITGGSTGFMAAGSPFEGTVPVAFQQLRLGASTNIAVSIHELTAQDDIATITTRAIRTLAAGDVLSVWFGTLATLLEAKLRYLTFQCKRIG